jgi:hypothetical protein
MGKKVILQLIAVTALAGTIWLNGCATRPKPVCLTPVTVFALPTARSGTQGTCPGSYSGCATYTKTVSAGWGWAPDTNTTVHNATNGGARTDVRVEYVGEYGDSGCDSNSVTLPGQPISPKYDFDVYFASNPPTTNYPIILTGFNP